VISELERKLEELRERHERAIRNALLRAARIEKAAQALVVARLAIDDTPEFCALRDALQPERRSNAERRKVQLTYYVRWDGGLHPEINPSTRTGNTRSRENPGGNPRKEPQS
jgi:hypothetical protein